MKTFRRFILAIAFGAAGASDLAHAAEPSRESAGDEQATPADPRAAAFELGVMYSSFTSDVTHAAMLYVMLKRGDIVPGSQSFVMERIDGALMTSQVTLELSLAKHPHLDLVAPLHALSRDNLVEFLATYRDFRRQRGWTSDDPEREGRVQAILAPGALDVLTRPAASDRSTAPPSP